MASAAAVSADRAIVIVWRREARGVSWGGRAAPWVCQFPVTGAAVVRVGIIGGPAAGGWYGAGTSYPAASAGVRGDGQTGDGEAGAVSGAAADAGALTSAVSVAGIGSALPGGS